MTDKMVDISVITPFYKGNAYMEQLFGCIRRNAAVAPDVTIELVLVNDSPGIEISFREEWVEGFSLQICVNPFNVGIQKARVNGLYRAKGTFVVFLDQDDLIADNALLSQYQHAQDFDIVVSNGYNENRDKNTPIYHSLAHQKQVAYSRFYLSVGCLIASPGQCLIRKNSIPRIWKNKCIDCNGADDYLLWLLMHSENCRWGINPDVLYTHVDTGENLSLDLDRMINSSIEVLDLLKKEGKLTERQNQIARRRFRMRKFYEGREKWRKLVACLLYPDLFFELMVYTYLKKFCRP